MNVMKIQNIALRKSFFTPEVHSRVDVKKQLQQIWNKIHMSHGCTHTKLFERLKQ